MTRPPDQDERTTTHTHTFNTNQPDKPLWFWTTDDDDDLIRQNIEELMPEGTRIQNRSLQTTNKGSDEIHLRRDMAGPHQPILTWLRIRGATESSSVAPKLQFKLNLAMELVEHQVKRNAHYVLILPGSTQSSAVSDYIVNKAKDLPPASRQLVRIRQCNLGITVAQSPNARLTRRNVHMMTNLPLPKEWRDCIFDADPGAHVDYATKCWT